MPSKLGTLKGLGGVYDRMQDISGRVYDPADIAPTIPTVNGGHQEVLIGVKPRVRKLTERECWRLMGFDDEDFNKAAEVCSKTQLYKQAGNSIVVNVLELLLKELLLSEKQTDTNDELYEWLDALFEKGGTDSG